MAYIAPRKHQLELKEALINSPGMGVIGYHGMGLGKTYSSIISARILIARLKVMFPQVPNNEIKVVVLCPKSAVLTWKQELNKFAPDLIPFFIIVPYSQLKKFNMRIRNASFKYAMLVLDECHYVKNPQADRTLEFATMLQSMAPNFHGKILPITGTLS